MCVCVCVYIYSFPGGASGKEPPVNEGNVRDAGSIPGSGNSPGGGHTYIHIYIFFHPDCWFLTSSEMCVKPFLGGKK